MPRERVKYPRIYPRDDLYQNTPMPRHEAVDVAAKIGHILDPDNEGARVRIEIIPRGRGFDLAIAVEKVAELYNTAILKGRIRGHVEAREHFARQKDREPTE